MNKSRVLSLVALWAFVLMSSAFGQDQSGVASFPIAATDTNYATNFKKYLYSFALPHPSIGVIGIGGHVTTVSQTNAFSEALIGVRFLPTGNCPTDGSAYDTYDQIGQAFPGNSTIVQFIVKSPGAGTTFVPTEIPLPIPIAVRGCIFIVLDGGILNIGGALTMSSGMSLVYVPGPTPPASMMIGLDDAIQISPPSSGQTGYAKTVRITQAATLVGLYGNVSNSALGPIFPTPPPTGPWTTYDDYYFYPGCTGMTVGQSGPADYYSTIPANAVHLMNITMQGTGDTAREQTVSQTYNQPLAVGDCLVHLYKASTNGAIDAESQVIALTTSP